MCNDNDYKEVCSVSQLAGRLGISRARFYQLLEAGVFPAPVYCQCKKRRPFYTYELQQRCIAIRRTGIGYNGQVVVFYDKRKGRSTRGRTKLKQTPAELYQRLTKIMKQVGINVTINEIKEAIKNLYPEGLVSNEPDSELIKTMFKYLRESD